MSPSRLTYRKLAEAPFDPQPTNSLSDRRSGCLPLVPCSFLKFSNLDLEMA